MRTALRAVVAATALLAACDGGGPDQAELRPVPPPEADSPREVTVRGRVADVPDRHVVILGQGDQAPLVVVLRHPMEVTAGTTLTVTGQVRAFRVGELEAELGTDLSPAIDGFEGVGCLVASSVAAL